MAAEPCSERAEGAMSKHSVKKDKKKRREEKKKKKKKKKKREEEAVGTKGEEQKFDAAVENLAAESDDKAEGKQSSKLKKSKRKRNDDGEAPPGDEVVAKQGKNRKMEHPVVLEESSQKQAFDTTAENVVAEADKVEGKQSGKSNKSKHKRNDAGEASAGDQAVTREEKRRKKEHPVVVEESSQKQTLGTSAENSATERNKVEVEQSSKTNKSRHRRNDSGEASAGDQAVTRERKKKKKSSQPKNNIEGENGAIKERGKEGDKSGSGLSENASAQGEEANADKKKRKNEEGTQEGTKEKEKAARSKNKGKRVSFADSTEVFRTEGGDGEGSEGVKNKKKKATQSKNKGKRVSFADSAEVYPAEGGDAAGTGGAKKKKKKETQSKNKIKRVSFADSAELFSIEGGGDGEGGSSDESKFVYGQRFTPEEDATIMEAIHDFIEMKQLGEEGLEMMRSTSKHPELRHCWKVIAKSLPHRPPFAIYKRAHVLLNRSDERKWTQEEKDYIRRFVRKNGTDWKTLAHELGKCRIHVKDTWRRIKSENLKKGHWTQDEQQQLFDLVNLDLRMKAHQIKDTTNRKLRDNISWEAISDKLTTRNHKNCCLKWYDTLASPLVRKGIWADVDDYLLVEALQRDDAVCVEDVDWDSLLDHRSGEVCRQRWNQMVRGLGGHRERPFIEQVDVLSRRYCPEMIEFRKPQDDPPAETACLDKTG